MTGNPILATRIGVNRINMVSLGDIKKASLALKMVGSTEQSFEYKVVWFRCQWNRNQSVRCNLETNQH